MDKWTTRQDYEGEFERELRRNQQTRETDDHETSGRNQSQFHPLASISGQTLSSSEDSHLLGDTSQVHGEAERQQYASYHRLVNDIQRLEEFNQRHEEVFRQLEVISQRLQVVTQRHIENLERLEQAVAIQLMVECTHLLGRSNQLILESDQLMKEIIEQILERRRQQNEASQQRRASVLTDDAEIATNSPVSIEPTLEEITARFIRVVTMNRRFSEDFSRPLHLVSSSQPLRGLEVRVVEC